MQNLKKKEGKDHERNETSSPWDVKKMLGEDRYLKLNGMPYNKVKDLNTHIEIECLPGRWGYDYFGAQAAYARNIQKKVLYMTGRFQNSWGDFGGLKSKASLENDMWDALSNGVDVSIGKSSRSSRLRNDSTGKVSYCR